MELREIIKIGKKIGFNSDFNSNTYSFPCKIKLKDSTALDYVTICFCPLTTENDGLEVQNIVKIEKSQYALSQDIRDSSLKTQDFKGDRPFFLRTSKGAILGYNAIDIVDFTFHDRIKSKNILSEVDFDTARIEGFEMIKNHREKGVTITIELTSEIKEQINK